MTGPRALSLLFVAPLALTLSLTATDASASPEYRFEYDWHVALAPRAPDPSTFGFITELTIGDVALQADLDVTDPVTHHRTKIVGVVKSWQWGAGIADPIHYGTYVSGPNTDALARKLAAHPRITVKYVLYACARTCFVQAKPQEPAQLSSLSSEVVIDAESEGPGLHLISFDMRAPSTPSQLLFAMTEPAKVIKMWGVKQGN